MSLGIKDNGISFKKYQVSAGDDQLFVASDKYDDRMSGNIKIPHRSPLHPRLSEPYHLLGQGYGDRAGLLQQ